MFFHVGMHAFILSCVLVSDENIFTAEKTFFPAHVSGQWCVIVFEMEKNESSSNSGRLIMHESNLERDTSNEVNIIVSIDLGVKLE